MTRIRSADLRFWALLLLAAFALRAAGFVFGGLNVDEIEFGLIGKVIAAGGLSYVDVVEFKPPLAHLLFAPGAPFGRASIQAMHVLGVLWTVATAWVLALAAREWTGSEDAGRAAAVLSLLAGLCELPWVSTELLLNLPAAAAVLFFVRAERSEDARDDLLCGLFVALASLIKHQAAVAGIAFVLTRLWSAVRRERGLRPAGHLAMAAGFVLPWAATFGIYAALGHAAELIEWVVRRNLGYASHASVFSWTRALGSSAVAVAATAPAWALASQASLGQRVATGSHAAAGAPGESVRRGLSLLLWLTWIPVAAGGRFYEHYFLQFVPPLALLGAPLGADLWARRRSLSNAARTALGATLAIPVAVALAYSFARGAAGGYAEQDRKCREVAAFLRAHAGPSDRIFVWGHAPQIYSLSGLLPGSRYISGDPLIGGFDPAHVAPSFDATAHRSVPDLELLVSDLDRRGTAWVIDTAPADIHSWGRMPLAAYPELRREIAAHYRPVGAPAGAVVYRRGP